MRILAAAAVAVTAAFVAQVRPATGAAPVETIRSVGGLPAHIAGRFNDQSICRQTEAGTFLVFDRRSHTVYSVDATSTAPTEIVQIGAEPGRLLQPYAFDARDDGTFVVADAPENRTRIQMFLASGSRLGGFQLPAVAFPLLLDGLAITGLGSLVLSDRSVFFSQPESGSLIVERGLDGVSSRAFGELRESGHEQDKPLHAVLNSGLVVLNPEGGFYYVFVAGRPAFRKYDALGTMIFERHIEGLELDAYMRDRPRAWPTRKAGDGQFPLVRPAVRAAAADRSGNLWISLDVPFTYVYDRAGEKTRIVQWRGAGVLAPNGISFTAAGQLLATPGCYLFNVRAPAKPRGR